MGQSEGQREEREPSDFEYAPDSPYKAARDAAISQQHPAIMPIDLRSGNNYSAADGSASVTSDGGTPPILPDMGKLLYEAARDVSSTDDTEGDDTEDEDGAIAPPCDSHRQDSVENGDIRDEKGTGSLGEATRRHPAGSSVSKGSQHQWKSFVQTGKVKWGPDMSFIVTCGQCQESYGVGKGFLAGTM